MPDTIESLRIELSTAQARASAAETALARAEADRARLDWLENALCYAMVSPRGRTSMVLLPNNGHGWDNGKLRASIDAQITAAKEQL